MKKINLFLITIVLTIFSHKVLAKEVSYTLEDRDRLIRVETRLNEMDKRFEQVDKRFEELRSDMDKRFDQMFTFLWILSGIFTAMTTATISFAIWDRRSMLKPVEMKVKELEEGKMSQLINSLKDIAKIDKNVAEVLKRYNLL